MLFTVRTEGDCTLVAESRPRNNPPMIAFPAEDWDAYSVEALVSLAEHACLPTLYVSVCYHVGTIVPLNAFDLAYISPATLDDVCNKWKVRLYMDLFTGKQHLFTCDRTAF